MIYHRVLRPPRYDVTDAPQKATTINLRGDEFNEKGPIEFQSHAHIAFVGVWDTVEAYGMPVDELKLAIDRWVWPMSFADRTLSPNVDIARQALSLDDERPTFRPVLWNEVPEGRDAFGPEKIQQVWFAGVHANVGGGYPDDGLAYVALDWMMTEAEKANLRFYKHARQEIRCRVDANGEQYDSRSGLAGYYRYGPRSVKDLCDEKEHKVEVPIVRVHNSVFERIEEHQVGYAPVSLNKEFQINNGPARPSAQLKADTTALNLAMDVVWWRRLAYFATLALTIFVGLFALRLAFDWPNSVLRATEAVLGEGWGAVTSLFGPTITSWVTGLWKWFTGTVGGWMPGWMSTMLASLAVYPLTAIVSIGVLALFFFKITEDLHDRIDMLTEWAWAAQKQLPVASAPPPNWQNTVARRGRPFTAWLYRGWRLVIVNLLGILIALTVLLLGFPIWVFRVLRHRPWMAARDRTICQKLA